MITSQDILQRFSVAASRYNTATRLQQSVAWRLACHCRRLSIPKGIWADLGSGTGWLADALEATHPGYQVLRVDGSAAMLNQQRNSVKTIQHDLSKGLPSWPNQPQLLASNFALHWLPNPVLTLNEWIQSLTPGDWLAVAVPVRGSFPQWRSAAAAANQLYTAFSLPHDEELIATIPARMIRRQQVRHFTQTAITPISLLKPIIDIGAGVTNKGRLSPGAWRRIFRAWPEADSSKCLESGGFYQKRFGLSWKVLLLILNR
ncbi:methyltransferase domain-containing protein [Synechococcus sp. M16CYN]|uniref:methyltransferase domain-containing protein n=1 Tax=Synechococcus sp. M16CYN TaxID=3103139 RepID=UPI00334205C0